MTILALFLYALLLLVVSLLGDRTAVNEIRWRCCKLWHTQVKPVLSIIEGWRLRIARSIETLRKEDTKWNT